MNTQRTLVIHPADPTTDFLGAAYNLLDYTVLRTDCSTNELKGLIKSHERIVMMGHGCEQGLFGHNKLFINSKLTYLLRQKTCIAVWCNADGFFKKYKIKGLYTGMIISEMEEALYCCVPAKALDIDYSNYLLPAALKFALQRDNLPAALENIKNVYKAEVNPVILFNKDNFYIN